MVEVIEHILIEEHQNLFNNLWQIEPNLIIITTPNRSFNKFFNMLENDVRDPDHKFEFDCDEFAEYIDKYCDHQNYTVEVSGI